MDPSIVVASLALLGVVITGVITARKDRAVVQTAAHSQDTDAAIESLKTAFETQRTMTQDCLGQCAQLREHNATLQSQVDDLKRELRDVRRHQ